MDTKDSAASIVYLKHPLHIHICDSGRNGEPLTSLDAHTVEKKTRSHTGSYIRLNKRRNHDQYSVHQPLGIRNSLMEHQRSNAQKVVHPIIFVS